MYTLDIQDENIFEFYNMSKIKCIGKCTKGTTPQDYKAKFFLTNRGKKYEAFEELHGLEDIKVTLKEVDTFTLPGGQYWAYQKWSGITRDAMKKHIIDNLGEMAFSKDGFVIFKQMYYQENGACMGGIDDIYIYEPTTKKEFKELLAETEANLTYVKEEHTSIIDDENLER